MPTVNILEVTTPYHAPSGINNEYVKKEMIDYRICPIEDADQLIKQLLDKSTCKKIGLTSDVPNICINGTKHEVYQNKEALIKAIREYEAQCNTPEIYRQIIAEINEKIVDGNN